MELCALGFGFFSFYKYDVYVQFPPNQICKLRRYATISTVLGWINTDRSPWLVLITKSVYNTPISYTGFV